MAAQPVVAQPVPAPIDSLESGTEGLPIRRIIIETRDVFEPLPPGRLRPLYRLANRLHVRTRARTVRNELLFAPGEPWSAARARETERALRALEALDPQLLVATREGDSVIARVVTRDAWSTAPEFVLESGGGKTYGAVSVSERNLLGLGQTIEASYREDAAGISRSVRFLDPNMSGQRLRVDMKAATGSAGVNNRIGFELPFYAEDSKHSVSLRWNRSTSVARLYQLDRQVADFDRFVEDFEFFVGRGTRLANGSILRAGGAFRVFDRRFGPARLDPGAPPQFAGDEETLRLRRVTAEGRWWRPRFVEKQQINLLAGIEDIDLGSSVRLEAGVAPEALGSAADEGYLRARLDGGVEPSRAVFAQATVDVETRLRREPLETLTGVEARVVAQSGRRHTLVGAVQGYSGWRPARDFQVVAGGLNGLRAFPVQAVAGQQLWRVNMEDRFLVGHNYFEFGTVGLAVFWDAARAWGPGSAEAGWFHDAGAGLRLAFPRPTEKVVRLDIAFPLSPRDGRRSPVFSFGSSQAF